MRAPYQVWEYANRHRNLIVVAGPTLAVIFYSDHTAVMHEKGGYRKIAARPSAFKRASDENLRRLADVAVWEVGYAP